VASLVAKGRRYFTQSAGFFTRISHLCQKLGLFAAVSNARSLAASTFTTLAEIKPALKVNNLGQSFLRADACANQVWLIANYCCGEIHF